MATVGTHDVQSRSCHTLLTTAYRSTPFAGKGWWGLKGWQYEQGWCWSPKAQQCLPQPPGVLFPPQFKNGPTGVGAGELAG